MGKVATLSSMFSLEREVWLCEYGARIFKATKGGRIMNDFADITKSEGRTEKMHQISTVYLFLCFPLSTRL
jgi:hypothetical protein